MEPEPRADSEPAVVNASTDAELLQKLEARSKMAPQAQRELFATECAAGDAPAELAAIVAKANGAGVTVVSANCYYGQCTTTSEAHHKTIDPARTMAAILSLLKAGADVVCMQEVCGPEDLPEGQGKDSYDFDFFPKADFAPWPAELEKLGAQEGVKLLWAPAKNSSMYRHSFGNALAINTATLKVDESTVMLQDCLTEPTEEEGFEGRAAVTVVVEPVDGGGKLAVCCTHLTEKQIGECGEKQCEMIEALVDGTLSNPAYAGLPMVLCGDFNINNVSEQPPASAGFCRASPYLHPHPDHDPYAKLVAAGFTGGQYYAQKQGLVLNTCWNAGCVDYNGTRGATPLAFGVVDPTHDGMVIADHRWPVAVYSVA